MASVFVGVNAFHRVYSWIPLGPSSTPVKDWQDQHVQCNTLPCPSVILEGEVLRRLGGIPAHRRNRLPA